MALGELVRGEHLHLVIEERNEDVELLTNRESETPRPVKFDNVVIALKNATDQYLDVSNWLQGAYYESNEEYRENDELDVPLNRGQLAPGEVGRGEFPLLRRDENVGDPIVIDTAEGYFETPRFVVDFDDRASDPFVLEQNLRIEPRELGSVEDVGGFSVGVHGIEFDDRLAPPEHVNRTDPTPDDSRDSHPYWRPPEDYEFAIVDLEIRNETGETKLLDYHTQVVLKDETGASYSNKFLAESLLDDAFGSGYRFEQGDSRTGRRLFGVPTGADPLYFVFELHPVTGGDKTFWQLR